MTEQQEKQYKELLPVLLAAGRVNFWAFCCYWDFEFFRINRRFLKEVALLFQEVADAYREGRAMTVSVSMPPRAGKSYITSLFAAWWLAQFPDQSVMRNTCTAALYNKFSYDTRAVLRDPRYTAIFPEIRLKADKQNIDGWTLETSKQVAYFGAGVGGSIIGFGANLAITDDLYKDMADALSDAVQSSTDMWKGSAHDSRMEKNCPEIFIGTRWSNSDVIGKAMASGKIQKTVVIRALVDGETFCDHVKSTEEYLKIREELGADSMTWMAEYQQEPIEVKGLLLPKSELMFDTINTPPENFAYRFAVGDPADTGGDKFAVPFVYVTSTDKGIRCYVVDALCNTDGIMMNTPQIVAKCKQHAIDDLYIESNGVGLASVIDLSNKLDSVTELKPFASTENKDVRILSHYEFIKRYFVFQNDGDAEYRQFIQDLTSYVKGGQNTHRKDAIDVLCRAAEIVKIRYFEDIYG
jgi:hypothetical protein